MATSQPEELGKCLRRRAGGFKIGVGHDTINAEYEPLGVAWRMHRNRAKGGQVMYTTKLIIKLDGFPGSVIKNHPNMESVLEYVCFHNLVYGHPAANTAFVAIEHVDGSPLNGDELALVKREGSRSEFAKRANKGYVEQIYTPECGALHAEAADVMRKLRRKSIAQ